MKDFCRMKPLANNTTTGVAPTTDISEINGKRQAQLVAILNPDENTDQSKGWVCVVASTELPPEMESPKYETNKAYLGELRFTLDQQRELLNRIYCPKKMAANTTAATHECLYIGNYSISSLQTGRKPVEIKCTSEQNKDRSIAFLQREKCKFLVDELDDCSMILLPVAEDTIINPTNLEENVSSAPPSSRTRALISGADENEFPLAIGLFLSTTPPPKEQWRSLMGCVATLQENLFKKSKASSEESGGSRKGFEFLKWITTRKHQKRVEEYCRGEGEDGGVNEQEQGKLLGRIGGGGGRKYHKNKNSAGQRKVKRIKFGGGNKGGNHNAFEKKNAGERALVVEDRQLIRIELKPDPLIQESSFQFRSGDLLRLKLTMFEFPVDNGYEVDIDFLQNFMCETDALQSSCRCRRISKLVHRTIITDFNWERGVNISGQQFAVCWIPFTIPGLDPDENANDPIALAATLSLDKFKVASFQYELQIRLYKDDEQSHYILSASSFPLNIEIETKSSSLSPEITGAEDDGGDILQIFHEEEQPEVEYLFAGADDYSLMMRKSLSACEFDV